MDIFLINLFKNVASGNLYVIICQFYKILTTTRKNVNNVLLNLNIKTHEYLLNKFAKIT